MRKLIPIGILLLLYLACSSRSCTEGGPPGEQRYLERLLYLQDSVIQQFGKEELNDMDLRLFEQAAIQKLIEWNDFIRIATDTVLEDEFRTSARQMARGLFLSEDAAVRMEDSLTIYGSWYPDSITTGRLLTRFHANLYTGSLNYRRVRTGSMGQEPQVSKSTIPVCAARTTKVFGTDTLTLWAVFLGGN